MPRSQSKLGRLQVSSSLGACHHHSPLPLHPAPLLPACPSVRRDYCPPCDSLSTLGRACLSRPSTQPPGPIKAGASFQALDVPDHMASSSISACPVVPLNAYPFHCHLAILGGQPWDVLVQPVLVSRGESVALGQTRLNPTSAPY